MIYNKLQVLADTASVDNSTFTRNDLAWEFKEDFAAIGIEGDSPEISKIVWECYQMTRDEAVAKCFVTNNRSYTLVEEYRVPALVEAGKMNSVFNVIDGKLEKSGNIISHLQTVVANGINLKLVDEASNLINTVSGAEAVKRIQDEAQQIFAKYSDMAGAYSDARNVIRELVADFSELRQFAYEAYKKYALELVDMFGEQIKASMPELFDFDTIEFLDVDAMKQNVKLAYDGIYGKCGVLLGEVSESFTKSLSRSASQFSEQSDHSVGLVLAGITMISHYVKTGQKATALHRDLAELRGAISSDEAAIRTDEVRLMELYKLFNDVMIPESQLFALNAPKVFDEEFEELIDTLYSTPETRALKQERDQILKDMHQNERRINDANISISYYKDHIQSCQETLSSLKGNYIEAQVTKPEPPKFFVLPPARRKYERDLYEWDKSCKPVIDTYESLALDISVENDEIARRHAAIDDDTLRYNELKIRLMDVSKRLSALVGTRPELKKKAARHLDSIVKLLVLAKKIVSTRLDDRLVTATKVTKFDDIQLPKELVAAVKDFKDSLTKNLKFTENDAVNLTNSKVGKEIITDIAGKGDALLQDGVSFCENVARLKVMRLKQTLGKEMYDREFKKLKAEFDERMKLVDDKAAFIRETAKKINTADEHDALKEALLELVGANAPSYTQKDWDDFLDGKKIIEI